MSIAPFGRLYNGLIVSFKGGSRWSLGWVSPSAVEALPQCFWIELGLDPDRQSTGEAGLLTERWASHREVSCRERERSAIDD